MDDVTQLPDGEHREYNEDRVLKAVYTVKDGKIEGEYKEYDPSYSRENPVVVDNYKDGKLHGVCKKCYGSNNYVESVYDNGVLQSRTVRNYERESVQKYENGKMIHEVVRDGDKVISDMEYRDGKFYNGFYNYSGYVGINKDLKEVKYQVKDGKYQGEYVDTLEGNGVVAHYEDGVLHGKYRSSRDSEVKEGTYYQGKFTGTHIKNNGNEIEFYRDGELDCTEFYEQSSGWNSKKHLVARVRENGECKELGKNGTIIRYQQKNGVKDGTYEVLDADGRWVRESGTYKNGKLNGVYREFNSDGTVAARRFYKDGEDITPQQEVLRAAAAKNVNKENKEGKVNPKQSKIKKAQVALEMKMAGVKNKLMG